MATFYPNNNPWYTFKVVFLRDAPFSYYQSFFESRKTVAQSQARSQLSFFARKIGAHDVKDIPSCVNLCQSVFRRLQI